MLLSAAAQPGRSWAGLIALAAAYVIFRVATWVWANVINKPSPARALPGVNRTNVQATVGVTPDDTSDTERGELDWWGRIREVGGVRMRQVKQIARTGSSELPPAEDEPDGDVDVSLDDEDQGEPVEAYIARCRELGVPYVHIVRVLEKYYELTVDQAKYRIRKVDRERGAGRAAA